jgi:RNA polymerase-binding transcription factor DksA
VAETDPNSIDVHDVPGTARTPGTDDAADVRDAPGTVRSPAPEVDLDAIERDLAGVERALERLSDGTYWTDEVTGEPIADHVLADDPTARRA